MNPPNDGTVWFGGEARISEASRNIPLGTIVQVEANGRTILNQYRPTIRSEETESPKGRIEDIAIDQLGRIHFIFLAQNAAGGIVANGDIVLDANHLTPVFCQTVNVFDEAGNANPVPLLGPRSSGPQRPRTATTEPQHAGYDSQWG